MKTVLFTQDSEIITLASGEDAHVTESKDELITLVGDGPAVLILDYDLDKKASEAICKSYSDNEMMHCIAVGKSFSAKELKKLQGKDDAASGYFGKPFEASTFQEIVEDFELIAGSEVDDSNEDLEYEDGDTSPTQVTEEASDLPATEEIPQELTDADGEAISFDEADDGITFDMGEESSDDDATDPSRTDVTLSEKEDVSPGGTAEDDAMEFDIGEEEDIQFGAPSEAPEEVNDSEEMEFDVGEDEEVSLDATDVAETDDDPLEFVDESNDPVSEEAPVALEEDHTNGITLGAADDFGELELSSKSEAKSEVNEIEEETGELELGGAGSAQDSTGEYDTAATELNRSEAADPIGTSDYTRPAAEANASEEVKLLSDEDKAAIARIEKIDYTYDENEMVKTQITIRHMREERQSLLKEIDQLKSGERQKDQDLLSQRAELDESKIEVTILKKRRTEDMDNIKYQLRLSEEKKKIFEEKLKHYQGEFSKLDQKVRVDINQVRQKEKDLENKLELTAMDAESQIKSRDIKIGELKQKIDSLEFNMENVSINEHKLKEDKIRLEERIAKIMATLRNSISLIEDDIDFDDDALLERLNKL